MFEQFQPIAAEPLTVCPKEKCAQKRWGKGKIRRAISGGGGLIFKGSGFYITDYRSDSYKEAAKKDSSASASPPKEAPSAPKTESKPKEASPAKPAAPKPTKAS